MSVASTRTATDPRQRMGLLRRAKRIWSQLQPGQKIGAGRAVKRELSFSSSCQIASEIKFRIQIQATEVDGELVRIAPELKIPFGVGTLGLREGDVSVRAHGSFHDGRTVRLASQAEDRDIADLPFIDFDVHAIDCQLEGKPFLPWPHTSAGQLEAKLQDILELYSQMVARVWGHFGGHGREAFEKMALWVLENGSGRPPVGNEFGAIFAADLYGNKALASLLLDELEAKWDRVKREDADNVLAQNVGAEKLEAIRRARRMLAV